MEKFINDSDVIKSVNDVTDSDIDLINKYTRRKFEKNELYIFSVVLCDNEIDRDNEIFSVDALENMSRLFVGKTGITDHNPSADNQTARIFSCRVEKCDNKKTSYGQDYYRLVAKAYIPVNENTKQVIQLIESGIKKEVSVGCSVDEILCSICGADIKHSHCEHHKNNCYNSEKCYHILNKVNDAYEWSFVAIPSQREAGVIKNYNCTENEVNSMENILYEVKKGNYKSINSQNVKVLVDYIIELEKYSEFGKVYYEKLKKNYIKYNTLLFEGSDENFFRRIAEKCTVQELEEFVKVCKDYIESDDFEKPQLVKPVYSNMDDDNQYNI